MHQPAPTAACPACAAPGAVAQPCDSAACARFGLHRVPLEYAPTGRGAPDRLVGRMFGEYLVVRRLGAGGVGAVYLALQQPIGLPAALKLLHADGSALATGERFRREAAALARLRHPNIVRLLKYGIQGDDAYLVMEHVEGGRTLKDALREGIAVDDASRILTQMCHGLEAAHTRGVVHRDIKPANVMLEPVPGESHFVRIVDFGLVKFAEEGHSTRLAAGTPRYMAPEQMLKTGIGPWTDGYAVTVIACEMLTGRHPFRGDTAQAIMLRKHDPGFDPVADLGLTVGPMMAELLRRGLAPTLSHRYRDMPSLKVALDAALTEFAGDTTPGLGTTLPTPPGGSSRSISLPIVATGSADATPPMAGRWRPAAAGLALAGAALAGWIWWLPPDPGAGRDAVVEAPDAFPPVDAAPADAAVVGAAPKPPDARVVDAAPKPRDAAKPPPPKPRVKRRRLDPDAAPPPREADAAADAPRRLLNIIKVIETGADAGQGGDR